ncbi:unnamed protein product [Auanema sp. JU1783]|nr:unnamed protein product [Auanema sp. JU1783]
MSLDGSRGHSSSTEDREQNVGNKLKYLKNFDLTNGMCEILPNLYLGGLRDVTDVNQIAKNKIEYVLTILDMKIEFTFQKNMVVKRIRIPDSPSENISTFFSEAIQYIHEARIRGASVAVHCLAGVSRSATIVTAYLITVCGLTFFNALSFVSSKRPAVNPNFGFRMQLAKYEKTPASHERQRLRELFTPAVFDRQWQLDRIATRAKLVFSYLTVFVLN